MKDLSLMIENVKLNVRVGVILEYNNRYLLEKGNNEIFSVVPGGRIKSLENSYTALIRELNEELGINLQKEKCKFISLIESFFEYNNIKYHELYFIYKIKLSRDYGIKDEMENLDNQTSHFFFRTKKEFIKEEILPKELKEIISLKKFKHYIINNIKDE